jgi:hypothetical protein
LPVVGASPALYHPALTKRDSMTNEDRPTTTSQPKNPGAHRGVLVVFAILVAGGLLFAMLTVRDNDGVTQASKVDDLGPPSSMRTTTTVTLKDELISRLREILADRQTAYRKRDPDILKEIYTVDCPCLESDSNAIRELIREDYVWVGGETSIRVRRSEQVTERMWIIVADFKSEPLQIQTEAGQTVRNEPRGSDLFEFVLAKPAGSTQWLLGRATSHESG